MRAISLEILYYIHTYKFTLSNCVVKYSVVILYVKWSSASEEPKLLYWIKGWRGVEELGMGKGDNDAFKLLH